MIAVNASPRGKSSNTDRLFKYFSNRMTKGSFNVIVLREFYNKNEMRKLLDELERYELILIGFPLYTDWLPGFVKELFEQIAERKEAFQKKYFLYFVQSGFPEANHSRYVEKYCKRFTQRIGAQYSGTIVRGNSEGARLIPEKYFKDAEKLASLGESFEREKILNRELLGEIAKPEQFTPFRQFLYRLIASTPVAHTYWNMQLKKNNVFKQRFDKPYIE